MNAIRYDEKALIQQVEKICASPEFRSKQVLCRFLSYIVSETLAGRGNDIKAFSIGVDVFNKDADFDPGQDTLVRINAGRLRRMLDLYYSNTGKDDKLRIVIPRGGYVPEIHKGYTRGEDERAMSMEASIAVLSFKDLSGDQSKEYFARGFSYELVVELTRFEDLQVYNYLTLTDLPEKGSEEENQMLVKGIRYVLGGAVHGDSERINILVDLRDLHNGRQIWSERYSRKYDVKNFIEIQEQIVGDISGRLGSEYGIILQGLSRDAHIQKPRELVTIAAILKYYNHLVQSTPESTLEVFEALNKAVEKEPDSGIALAFLAAMHGTAYGMDYPDSNRSFVDVGELAERAYALDPHNLFVQLSLIFKCSLYDEKERFFFLADRMLERNPRSTLRLGELGFHLALYGDWERGKKILDSVMLGNLEYPRYFHGATTLYYYRQKKYEKALQEAYRYRVPGYFWGPLLRAATLGQLSRIPEARAELKKLEKLKPGFAQNARKLSARFVKEESLVDHILEGLWKAGLIPPNQAL